MYSIFFSVGISMFSVRAIFIGLQKRLGFEERLPPIILQI